MNMYSFSPRYRRNAICSIKVHLNQTFWVFLIRTSSATWIILSRILFILWVQRPEFSRTRSISCLLMPWLLVSPGHQQPWCWPWTRQHSTQSVGNMPPPSPPHLLPQVLQIMPRNPKYDQFQPKGHHNEENPQSTTKMPGNPKFYPFH